jgi:hypothetical protein
VVASPCAPPQIAVLVIPWRHGGHAGTVGSHLANGLIAVLSGHLHFPGAPLPGQGRLRCTSLPRPLHLSQICRPPSGWLNVLATGHTPASLQPTSPSTGCHHPPSADAGRLGRGSSASPGGTWPGSVLAAAPSASSGYAARCKIRRCCAVFRLLTAAVRCAATRLESQAEAVGCSCRCRKV